MPQVCLQASLFEREVGRLATQVRSPEPVGNTLLAAIAGVVARVRSRCAEKGGHPRDLSARSRRAFATMAFLADAGRFWSVVAALRATRREVCAAFAEPGVRSSPAGLRLLMGDMGVLYRARLGPDALRLRLNLGYVEAPHEVLRAIVRTVIIGRTPARRKPWESYARTPEFQAVGAELDDLCGGALDRPAGRAHDLAALFERLNAQRFAGRLERPTLSWSRIPSTRLLGKYLGTLDHVELSSALDDPAVPADVVAYILFHELLHRVYPARWEGDRVRVHSPELRRAEAAYPERDYVERWILDFSLRGSSRP